MYSVISRLRCRSLSTITWSSMSLRQLPTKRSATPFCHGLRKLVFFGSMPKLLIVLTTSPLKFIARPKIRYLDCMSYGNASRSRWHTHAQVRMPSSIAVQDSPPVMGNDEEAIQDTEGQSRHGEKVHRRDRFSVVGQEYRPALCRLRVSRRLLHPAQHRPLGDFEAEHLQFTVNARRSPGWVLGHHAKDQVPQPFTDALSSGLGAVPRDPRPIALEPSTMPANHCRWLHKNQHLSPPGPEAPKQNPEQSIGCSEPRLRMPSLQGSKLLAQGQVFEQQFATWDNDTDEQSEEQSQQSPRWSPQKRPYAVTSKPAIWIGLRRDCFTVPQGVCARRCLSRQGRA